MQNLCADQYAVFTGPVTISSDPPIWLITDMIRYRYIKTHLADTDTDIDINRTIAQDVSFTIWMRIFNTS